MVSCEDAAVVVAGLELNGVTSDKSTSEIFHEVKDFTRFIKWACVERCTNQDIDSTSSHLGSSPPQFV